jgi:glycosyltransferase involved in cell wall biosynthesis
MAIIGIDATALCIPASRGIGTSQYQTMRALAEMDAPHRFLLYAPSPLLVPYTDEPLDLPWPHRLGARSLTGSNIVWMQTGVNKQLAADRVDLFWGPRHLLPFRARGIGKVATVHDYWHRYYPHQQRWRNRMADRVLIDRVVAQADLVVAPSAATARDVVRLSSGQPGKVRVVPWGVDQTIFHPLPELEAGGTLGRLGVKGPYLLSLDVLNPRKKFAAVLEAVSRLPADLRRSLTLVGLGASPASAAAATLCAQAARLGLGEHLRLLGEVTEEELVALYSRALALVYPSLYEGFGMPVLEAMACGCPVIASHRSSLPEVAGDAALLVDPGDPGQLGQAVAAVATDAGARGRLAAAGRARAKGFTWRATAEGMLAVFDEVLATRAARQERPR